MGRSSSSVPSQIRNRQAGERFRRSLSEQRRIASELKEEVLGLQEALEKARKDLRPQESFQKEVT